MAGSPSRDTCRFCGQVIYWGRSTKKEDPSEQRYYRGSGTAWRHLPSDPGDIYCSAERGLRSDRATPVSYCPEIAGGGDRWSSAYVCNRKVKRNGLCGIHASQQERQERAEQQRQEQYELDQYIRAETEKLIHRLESEFGLTVEKHYDYHNYRYTGRIILNPVELLELLDDKYEDFTDGD